MRKEFEEALMDLIDEYCDDTPVAEIISALELRLMALEELESSEEDDDAD